MSECGGLSLGFMIVEWLIQVVQVLDASALESSTPLLKLGLAWQ